MNHHSNLYLFDLLSNKQLCRFLIFPIGTWFSTNFLYSALFTMVFFLAVLVVLLRYLFVQEICLALGRMSLQLPWIEKILCLFFWFLISTSLFLSFVNKCSTLKLLKTFPLFQSFKSSTFKLWHTQAFLFFQLSSISLPIIQLQFSLSFFIFSNSLQPFPDSALFASKFSFVNFSNLTSVGNFLLSEYLFLFLNHLTLSSKHYTSQLLQHFFHRTSTSSFLSFYQYLTFRFNFEASPFLTLFGTP